MTAIQAGEPAAAPKAQAAGSPNHPDVGGVIAAMLAWLIVAAAVGLVSVVLAFAGTDPTAYLATLGAGWMFLTPFVLPDRRARRKVRR